MSIPPPAALVPGTRLDRYELLCPIATGGMATVWVGRLLGKHGFEKLVAVKTILPALAESQRFRDMFLDEAKIACGIEHPNVAQVIDLGEQGGILYIVMEYVDGESFSKVMRVCSEKAVRIPLGVAMRVLADTCAGLHSAHVLKDKQTGAFRSVVHRDVSPQNILLSTAGAAKLIDFGVAKAKNRIVKSTGAKGGLKGKLQYMAPEQAMGHEVDRRADVWAVGAILYAILTGHEPFAADTELAILNRIGRRDPIGPVPEATHPRIRALLDKALAYDPQDRFGTALEMHRALEDLMTETGLATPQSEVGLFLERHMLPRIEARRKSVDFALGAATERDRVAAVLAPELDSPTEGRTDGLMAVSQRLAAVDPDEADLASMGEREDLQTRSLGLISDRPTQGESSGGEVNPPANPAFAPVSLGPAYEALTSSALEEDEGDDIVPDLPLLVPPPAPRARPMPASPGRPPLRSAGIELGPRPSTAPVAHRAAGTASAVAELPLEEWAKDVISGSVPTHAPSSLELLDQPSPAAASGSRLALEPSAPAQESQQATPAFLDPTEIARRRRPGGAGPEPTAGSDAPPVRTSLDRPTPRAAAVGVAPWLETPKKSNDVSGLAPWIFRLGGVGAFLLLAVIVATALAPRLARRTAHRIADDLGVTLKFDALSVGFTSIRMSGVHISISDVPDFDLRSREGTIHLRWLVPESLVLTGTELKLDGPPDELRTRAARWYGERNPTTSSSIDRVTSNQTRVVWTKFLGPRSKLEAEEVNLEFHPGSVKPLDDLRSLASRVRIETPRGTLGPWRIDHDSSEGTSRTRIAFDPEVVDGPSMLVVDGPAGRSATLKVSRSPLSRLGIPASLVGLDANPSTQVEASAQLSEHGDHRVTGEVELTAYDARMSGARLNIPVHFSAAVAGSAGQPLELVRAKLEFAELGATAAGTLAFGDGAFRIDLKWNAPPLPCGVLHKKRAPGEASAEGFLSFDSRNPDVSTFTLLRAETCGLALFPPI